MAKTGPLLAPNPPSVTRFSRRCILKPLQVQVQVPVKAINYWKYKTIDAADFPQKSYIFFFLFSFWNWQLTKSTTCGKSFITLGPNQTINNGFLCQSCTEVTGTINYYGNFKMTFVEIQRSSRTFNANWVNWMEVSQRNVNNEVINRSPVVCEPAILLMYNHSVSLWQRDRDTCPDKHWQPVEHCT